MILYAIEVKGLVKVYDGKVRALDGVEIILIYHKIYGLPSGDRKKVIRDALEGMGLDGVADKLMNLNIP